MSNLKEHEAEQAEITAAWAERHAEYLPAEPGPDAKRWYVTVTWDNWPEGGSYGNVVTADDDDAAERAIYWEMAQSRVDGGAGEYLDESRVIEDLSDSWHVVDCFDFDEHIAKHARRIEIVPFRPSIEDQLGEALNILSTLRDGPLSRDMCDRIDALLNGEPNT